MLETYICKEHNSFHKVTLSINNLTSVSSISNSLAIHKYNNNLYSNRIIWSISLLLNLDISCSPKTRNSSSNKLKLVQVKIILNQIKPNLINSNRTNLFNSKVNHINNSTKTRYLNSNRYKIIIFKVVPSNSYHKVILKTHLKRLLNLFRRKTTTRSFTLIRCHLTICKE